MLATSAASMTATAAAITTAVVTQAVLTKAATAHVGITVQWWGRSGALFGPEVGASSTSH